MKKNTIIFIIETILLFIMIAIAVIMFNSFKSNKEESNEYIASVDKTDDYFDDNITDEISNDKESVNNYAKNLNYYDFREPETYNAMDIEIADIKTLDEKWVLDKDSTLYVNNMALEVACKNTGLKDLYYLKKEYKYMFVLDSDNKYIFLEEKDSNEFEIIEKGTLKNNQKIINVALNIGGDNVNGLDILDTATGNYYKVYNKQHNDSDIDLNGDNKWYISTNMAKQYKDGFIKDHIMDWVLDDQGKLYVHNSGSTNMDKEPYEYLKDITFKSIIGENDRKFNNNAFCYAITTDNELYILNLANSNGEDEIVGIIKSVDGEIEEATYSIVSQKFIIKTTKGYFYINWNNPYSRNEIMEFEMKPLEECNDIADDILKITENYVILLNGKVMEIK